MLATGFRLEKLLVFFLNHYLFVNKPLPRGFENFMQNENFNNLLKGFRVTNKSQYFKENCEIRNKYPYCGAF